MQQESSYGSHPLSPKKAAAFFVLVWLGLALVVWVSVANGFGAWVELFNGATWPPQFVKTGENPLPGYNFAFYAVVALRGVLNLGVLLTALTFAYVALTGNLPRPLMNKVAFLFRTHNVHLAEMLFQLLEERGIEVPRAVEEEAVEAARKFGENEKDAYFRKRVEVGSVRRG